MVDFRFTILHSYVHNCLHTVVLGDVDDNQQDSSAQASDPDRSRSADLFSMAVVLDGSKAPEDALWIFALSLQSSGGKHSVDI